MRILHNYQIQGKHNFMPDSFYEKSQQNIPAASLIYCIGITGKRCERPGKTWASQEGVI